MKTIPSALFTLLALSTLNACTSTHQIHNATTQPLYRVTVASKGQRFDHGILNPEMRKGCASNMKFKKSSPPRISWVSEDGARHEQEVPLSRNPGSRYETHFVISESDVKAFFYPGYANRPPPSDFGRFLIEIGARTPESLDRARRSKN